MRLAFRLTICALAFFDQWLFRYGMNPDGISYLDLGDALWKADWKAAFNPYWSPLFGGLTGLLFRLTHPSIRWEFPEVHLLQAVILCLTLFAFEFFLDAVLKVDGQPEPSLSWTRYAWAFGYLLFFRIHFDPVWIRNVTPDSLVAALSYLIFGLLLRLSAGRERTPVWVLGCLCGIAYLAKTPMLILGLICFALLFVVFRKQHRRLGPPIWALVVFLAISVPFATVLSIDNSHFTVGDSGAINIAWQVNHTTPRYAFWQGSQAFPAGHPVRKLNDRPAIYEFAFPIQGTYPPWYDPSYWYAGADTHPHLKNEIATASSTTQTILDYALRTQAILTVAVLIMCWLSDDFKLSLRSWFHHYWPILIPAIAYVILFGFVAWEHRYTPAEFVLLWGTLAISANLHSGADSSRVLKACVWSLAIVIGFATLNDMREAGRESSRDKVQLTVAEQLRDMGLKPGDQVAVIGDGIYASWARLAKTRIIAEVPGSTDTGTPAAAFWNSSAAEQESVLDRLRGTGAVAAISEHVPPPPSPGWVPIGVTGFGVFWLNRASHTPDAAM